MSDGVGALNVLEAARLLNKTKPVRVYQASSSEMYGMVSRHLKKKQRRSTRSRLCLREGLRFLSNHQLPTQLRSVCLQWHSVQSRVAAPW